MKKTAIISDCGKYRYSLDRIWEPKLLPMVFIMLNPSTADATEDDPTIRRCIGFAERENRGSIFIGNLFAYRATNPLQLYQVSDPVGHYNYNTVKKLLLLGKSCNQPVVCAWGSQNIASDEARKLFELSADLDVKLTCLGKNKSGSPKHPLYLKSDQAFEPYP